MHGCRYSVLLSLPYFNPIRMLAIDPMHTLFLCVAKHFLSKVLISKNLLLASHFNLIHSVRSRGAQGAFVALLFYKSRLNSTSRRYTVDRVLMRDPQA